MKQTIFILCAAWTLGAGADAKAELFKCVKDGKTTYQEQPCAGQGAETKIQTAKPSSWVGCYEVGGKSRSEIMEVRQDGSTLYIPTGMEAKVENRLLMKPATADELRRIKQMMEANNRGGGGTDMELVEGLAVVGVSSAMGVKPAEDKGEPRMGFYRIRSKAEGIDSLFAFFPFTFNKTAKVPCKK